MDSENHPLKLLFFSHSSGLYGAERRLLELVTELTEDYGATCTVCLPDSGPLVQRLQAAGASTFFGEYSRWCEQPGQSRDENTIQARFHASFEGLLKQVPSLRTLAPEVVISTTIVSPWGAVAAAIINKPHLWIITEYGEKDHGFEFNIPFPQVIDFVQASSNHVVTSSLALQNELFGSLNEERISTIYKHIPPPQSESSPGKETLIQTPGAIKLIIVGAITESKGQEDAVRAVVDLITRRGRNVELAVIGDAQPAYLNRLKQIAIDAQIETRIHFLPFQEDVFPFIRQADIVLVCSRLEVFSSVAVEAMLLKKAVIGTNSGGTPEIIHDGRTGLLFQPGNIPELVEQILRLIDQPTLQYALADQAIHFVQETFTRKNFGGRHNDILSAIRNAKNPLASQSHRFLQDLWASHFAGKDQELQD